MYRVQIGKKSVQTRYKLGTNSVQTRYKLVVQKRCWLFGKNKLPTMASRKGVKKLRFLENSQIDNVPGTMYIQSIISLQAPFILKYLEGKKYN